jgi:hypothetical protein
MRPFRGHSTNPASLASDASTYSDWLEARRAAAGIAFKGALGTDLASRR